MRQGLLNTATVIATGVAVALLLHRWTSGPRLGSIPASYRPRLVSEWRTVEGGPPRFEGVTDTASVTIVVFSDYLCPFCERAARSLERLRRRHGNAVRLVYRHFPVRSELSVTAAVAAECARQLDRFWTFNQLLFEASDSIGVIPWSRLARKAGIGDTTALLRCIEKL